MKKSPGHQQWPDHTITETLRDNQHIAVTVADDLVAEADEVLELNEDKHPRRYYFRRNDVKLDKLEASATTSECPFKGKATYFHLHAGGKRYDDAAWAYDEPYAEHARLAGRVAFYSEKLPGFDIDPPL